MQTPMNPANSSKRATKRDLRLGQRLQRARGKQIVIVYQIHRKDREVDVFASDFDGVPTGRDLQRVPFSDLSKYRQLDQGGENGNGR